jgi:Spy/CpxP family protein refolding chaperone
MFIPRHLSVLALAAALFVPVAASAQQAPPAAQAQPQQAAPGAAPAHKHRAGIRQALKQLNLTPDQRRQIAGIMKQTRLANQNADRPTRKANMKQMRAQIDGVLTADQQTQLRTTLRNMRHANTSAAPGAANPS